MVYVVLGLIGAVWGSLYFYGRGGLFVGGLLGLLAAAVISQRNRLQALDRQVRELSLMVRGLREGAPVEDAAAAAAGAGTDDTQSAKDADPVTVEIPPSAAENGSPAAAGRTPDDMPSLELELSDEALAQPGPAVNAPPPSTKPGRRRRRRRK